MVWWKFIRRSQNLLKVTCKFSRVSLRHHPREKGSVTITYRHTIANRTFEYAFYNALLHWYRSRKWEGTGSRTRSSLGRCSCVAKYFQGTGADTVSVGQPEAPWQYSWSRWQPTLRISWQKQSQTSLGPWQQLPQQLPPTNVPSDECPEPAEDDEDKEAPVPEKKASGKGVVGYKMSKPDIFFWGQKTGCGKFSFFFETSFESITYDQSKWLMMMITLLTVKHSKDGWQWLHHANNQEFKLPGWFFVCVSWTHLVRLTNHGMHVKCCTMLSRTSIA